MWVYQETETNAAALVPALPEDTAGESVAEKEAMTPASGQMTEMPPQKAPRRKPLPGQPGLHPSGGGLSLRYSDGGRFAGAVRR